MAVEVVRATYTEQTALETFLANIFGRGGASVIWRRGRFQCTIPRKLTEAEKEDMRQIVNRAEHY